MKFFFLVGIFWFDLSFKCYDFVDCLEIDEEICFYWRWILIEASMVVVMFVHNFYKTLILFYLVFSSLFMFLYFKKRET